MNKTELERLDSKYRLLAAEIFPANEKRFFDFIAYVGRNQINAEAFSIFIYDPASDKVWLKAGTGREERDIEVSREGSFVGKTIATRQRLTVKDADTMDGVHKVIDAATGFVTRNVACVPIHGMFRDEVVGVVQALNKVGGQGFSDEDVRFLEEAAYMLQLHADYAFLAQKESGATVFHQAFSRIVAAHALFEMKRWHEAEIYIRELLDMARGFGSSILEFDGLLLQARMDLDGGDPSRIEPGLEVLRRALALGRAHSYLNTVVWHPGTMVSLCCHALEHRIEEWYVQNLIVKRGLVSASSPHHLENWPWALRIYTFGRFSIVKDGKPVEFEAKAQKKTLAMLKALIAMGGREVSEQRLCDALWPDAEADDARRNFKVTLHRLRKIIGPDALLLQESKLQLDDRLCWVDAWSLERLLNRPPAAALTVEEFAKLEEQLLKLYQGSFLRDEEDAYAVLPRERLRGKVIRAITALAECLQRASMHDRALSCYQKGIEIEPLAESFYQGFMRLCQIQRRNAEGLAMYERCRKVLATQLQILPSCETEVLARALRGESG